MLSGEFGADRDAESAAIYMCMRPSLGGLDAYDTMKTSGRLAYFEHFSLMKRQRLRINVPLCCRRAKHLYSDCEQRLFLKPC